MSALAIRMRGLASSWPALALGVLLCCLAAWWPAWAQQAPIPDLRERITDTTGSLDAAATQRLTQTLAGLEQRKGAQIAVLMVPTTDGESIESYALRAFEKWGLGRSGVDDGILFVIAKDDRRLRVEVGYGLEGAVTDLQAGRIIREQVAPRFQQGDFAGGVEAGVDSLVKLVEGEELPAPAAPSSSGDSGGGSSIDPTWLWPLAFFILVLPPLLSAAGAGLALFVLTGSVVVAAIGAMVAFLISLTGRSAGAGPSRASRSGGSTSSSRASWGGGGGGFRGGGGGFSGGGGRSGGGGASGGW